MKKKLVCCCTFILVLTIASSAFAGGVVNRTNWSAEYIRTMNRNAATDYADIVFYNPAGTVHLDRGGYLNVSAHYFPKYYENNIKSGPFAGSYESDEPSLVPGVFTAYNAGRWALFFGVSNTLGGGKVDFDDGSLRTALIGLQTRSAVRGMLGVDDYEIVSQQIKAESYAPGYMVGGALQLTDNVSVSMGMRYIDASQKAKGRVTFGSDVAPDYDAEIDYEWDAKGVGAIFGINYTPSGDTTLAARYETRTSLNYRYTINSEEPIGLSVLGEQGVEDGTRRRQDLPASLGLGISHQFLPQLRAETNLTYYFNSDADWDGDEKKFHDGFDAGVALEYAFTPELKGSMGYMYTNIGLKSQHAKDIYANLPENPNLDAHTIGLGSAYQYSDNLAFNAGIGGAFYVDDDITTPVGDVDYEKTIYFLALGFQYKFL